MGIFGKIKDRMQHKEDFSDMRSHVIGEPFANEPFVDEPELAPMPRRERFESYEPRSGEVPTLEPMPFERTSPEQVSSNDYEILDRLKFIESQLAAIKSQNELINERIKNLDVKLGRRY